MSESKTSKSVKKKLISKEDNLHKIPLRITDTTLRDAHQSLWATRMRTEDMLNIIETVDKVGYYSLEVWGGATFDVCLRFLRENPWERLRQVKAKATRTPLQMLLRGQNLVGYRNYSDDVVDKFVGLAHENGVDIFRVFDALNDVRNLEAAIKAVKRHGGHAQGTLAYTISPVHTVEKYVQHAKDQVSLGIDSLCIKDMAGILTPMAAERLISALVKHVGIPIQMHCHATSGMGTATYVEGVRAGAGAIDCAISSMAGFTAQPPVETLAAIFDETNYSPNLNMTALQDVAKYFVKLAPKRRLKSAPDSVIDPGILIHQIPGGMISNFRSQLDMQGALDKLPEALAEVSRVRKDLGYPPLVTPTSQIVGTQAVMNILAGERYKIIPNEIKDYCRGMYGRSPAPIDKKFIKMVLGDEKPIDYRPADKIAPMLPDATDGLSSDLIEKDEDIISYCILPEPSLEYFKWRKLPKDQRAPIPADLEREEYTKKNVDAKDSSDNKAEVPAEKLDPIMHLDDYRGFGHILRQAAGMQIGELSITKGDLSLSVRTGDAPISMNKGTIATDISSEVETIEDEPVAKAEKTPEKKKTAPVANTSKDTSTYSHTINAPLVGTFYATSGPGKPKLVAIGDSVKKGEKVCIVEAMKLFNEIEAKEDCTIVAVLLNDGDKVSKDQPLVAYEPA